MHRNTRVESRALALFVVTAAVSLSGRVEAQQTGVFPLAPIRRERVPCDREDPTYKIYKHEYFGYHPTCWRTFPTGWGCPSKEAPDRAKSFKDDPPGHTTAEDDLGMPPTDDQGGRQPMNRAPLEPVLPGEERSPFETDTPAGAPGVTPLPRGNPAPGLRQRQPGEDPFAPMNGPGAALSRPRNRPAAGGAPSSPSDNAPDLTAPAQNSAAGSSRSRSRAEADDESVARLEEGPALGLPDNDLARAGESSSLDNPESAPAGGSADGTAATASDATADANQSPPPRRRIFGNLLSNLGLNWTRR